MKRIFVFAGLVSLTFIIINLLTIKLNAPSDGITIIGWPSIFYLYTEGKITLNEINTGFSLKNLLIDISFDIILTFFLYQILNYAKKIYKKKNLKINADSK
jgi:hypothetical protein